jgi:DNA methylase/Restriction endonuclease
MGNVWTDISPIGSQAKERLGYPTQKPVSLLERIVTASSNPDDLILDPFCGCGTAVHAAEKLGRKWIGIDITYLAVGVIERRMHEAFPEAKFQVIGAPVDFASAVNLAERDKYQFQWWACFAIGAQPHNGKKKGADGGIDGIIYFADLDAHHRPATKKVIVSVKGGANIGVAQIRDLIGTLATNNAEIGVFVTLTEPTGPMRSEAAKGGFYRGANKIDYPRIQILTIEQIIAGQRPKYPDMSQGTLNFQRAQREKGTVTQQQLTLAAQ